LQQLRQAKSEQQPIQNIEFINPLDHCSFQHITSRANNEGRQYQGEPEIDVQIV
jgi:hypothetical protein